MTSNRVTYLYISAAIFLPIVIQSGDSLWCYHCTTQSDPRCGDPFNLSVPLLLNCSLLLVETDDVKHVCRKMQILVRLKAMPLVQRSCHLMYTHSSSGIYSKYDPCPPQFKRPPSTVLHCSTCNVNGCNSASLPAATVVTLLLPLLVAQHKQINSSL